MERDRTEILLACNYFPEAETLAASGRIRVDFFKYPALGFQMGGFDDPDLAEYGRLAERLRGMGIRLLLHGLGQRDSEIGAPEFARKIRPEFTRRILELSGIRGISLHLCGGDTRLSPERRRAIIVDHIRMLREAMGELEFLSLENVDGNPYSDMFYSDCCIDPDFIRETVREADADFLLDISHAYGSALALGMDVREYIRRLPLERLCEIHINGWIHDAGGMMAHVKIHGEGYRLLEELLSRSRPRIVTLEYGRGDDRLGAGIPLMKPGTMNPRAMEEIEEQVTRLRELINCDNFIDNFQTEA